MHVVYILVSKKIPQFYIGESSDLNERLLFHNVPQLNNHWSRKGIPWEVFLKIPCASKQQALKIEAHIKSMKSRTYILNLAKYPEMIEKLFKKYPAG